MENLFLSAKDAKGREENLEKSVPVYGMGTCLCFGEILFVCLRALRG